MIKNNITACLFTSTKGHFSRTDLYHTTVSSLLSQLPSENWGSLLAHIKYGGTDPIATEWEKAEAMNKWLITKRFNVYYTYGLWRHGDAAGSHQIGYLKDIATLISKVTTPYVWFQEDDFVVKPYSFDLEYWLAEAVAILEKEPDIMQVRIPRYSNEDQRILSLKHKHNIDGKVEWRGDKWFAQNDYANHPSIMRTRDLRAALAFVRYTNLPQHSEAGMSMAMKMLSGDNPLPFACFNPKHIRCGHLGVATEAEQDNLDVPLIAT